MARGGKGYANNQRGGQHQSKDNSSGGRHSSSRRSSSSSSSEICIPFLANKCNFEKGCRKRHPPKEDIPRILARYKQIRCRFGDDCYTAGCLFLHPKDAKKMKPILIEPHNFPPLGGGSVGSGEGATEGTSSISSATTSVAAAVNDTSAAGGEGNDNTNVNSAWNNITSTDQKVTNNHPGSSSNSSTVGHPSSIQDHQYQQEQQLPPAAAWGYSNGAGGLPPPPQQHHMNPQGPPPPPAHHQQVPYYRGGFPAAAGTMIDPNTGYPVHFDPAMYYHHMQQLQYSQYPLSYPPMCPPGTDTTMESPLQAQAKEFVPGNSAQGYA